MTGRPAYSYTVAELDKLIGEAAVKDEVLAQTEKLAGAGILTRDQSLKIAALELSRECARQRREIFAMMLLMPSRPFAIVVGEGFEADLFDLSAADLFDIARWARQLVNNDGTGSRIYDAFKAGEARDELRRLLKIEPWEKKNG